VGDQAGSAEVLASCIMENMQGPGLLLFPKGNLAKETLGSILESRMISLDQVVVYKTETNQNLEKLLREVALPDWAIFFSPSGVTSSLTILERIYLEDFSKIKLMAIGPTTKKEIESAGYEVFRTASKPNPESVSRALLDEK